jgi:hypothetical protein
LYNPYSKTETNQPKARYKNSKNQPSKQTKGKQEGQLEERLKDGLESPPSEMEKVFLF